MNAIKELDAVALTCDLPEHRLARGDIGTAVPVPVSNRLLLRGERHLFCVAGQE